MKKVINYFTFLKLNFFLEILNTVNQTPRTSHSRSKSFNYKKIDSNFYTNRDLYETWFLNSRRSSKQQQKFSSSKMRKAVASAVFYDDFEQPVRC